MNGLCDPGGRGLCELRVVCGIVRVSCEQCTATYGASVNEAGHCEQFAVLCLWTITCQ